jgi:RNA polymerase sigma factor (sigma-70 family)
LNSAPATGTTSLAVTVQTDLRELVTPATSWSDTRLVEACLRGDEQAWVALIDKYKRLIFSVPVKYGMDRDSATDIFQAVCVDLFCELRQVRNAESLKWWLITVSVRKCRQWNRQRGSEIDIEEVDQKETIATGLSASEMLEHAVKEQNVRDAVAGLATRCRELILLLFYEHPPVPYADVAQKLGLATGSIGFMRGRCLKKLEKTLIEHGF